MLARARLCERGKEAPASASAGTDGVDVDGEERMYAEESASESFPRGFVLYLIAWMGASKERGSTRSETSEAEGDFISRRAPAAVVEDASVFWVG
jgi:hypothetical protein